MPKIFVDSSVLFTMSDSDKGASRELFQQALRGKVQLITSAYVLAETEARLKEKRPKGFKAFQDITNQPIWTIVNPTREDVLAVIQSKCTPDIGDAPVVAAAKLAAVSFLVSFDRKHVILPTVADYIGAIVTTPNRIVEELRAQDESTE